MTFWGITFCIKSEICLDEIMFTMENNTSLQCSCVYVCVCVCVGGGGGGVGSTSWVTDHG